MNKNELLSRIRHDIKKKEHESLHEIETRYSKHVYGISQNELIDMQAKIKFIDAARNTEAGYKQAISDMMEILGRYTE